MSRVSRRRRVAIATALAGIVSAAALAAISANGFSINQHFGQPVAAAGGSGDAAGALAAGRGGGADNGLTQSDDRPQQHIVIFRDAPLASYAGGVNGIARPARKGKGRIDVASAASRAYVGFVKDKQLGYEKRIGQALGRELKVERRMQHALNAIVATMSPLEAEAIARLPEVLHVEASRDVPLDTDIGPVLIGAANVWDGIADPIEGSGQARGEGVVVGVIDSGINFGSPSFAAVDPVDGYMHVNPNGSGNFLGTCAPGGVDEGRCNDKLIGGHDFVCGPPGNSCGLTTRREEPGFGDSNGHGSHTASTAAGNARAEVVNGENVTISGVAPRANVIAYDVCYVLLSTGQGLCPTASSAAAVDQAIADGVDVINFSISGGAQPWNDAVSLAFLNATNAGVFVAASAGNSGPGSFTLGHVEPWTTSSAASRHRLGGFTAVLSITGPGTVPANLQRLLPSAGANGVDLTTPVPGTTPLVVSPGIDTADDGCNPFAAGQFDGAIALIRRGACAFSIKVNNAAAAGAMLVVIANNTSGGITPSVPGTTIPAFGLPQADGNAIRDFAQANPGTTAGISLNENVVDSLASFSSRGPSGFDLLKPDITSPGVSVLAAYAGPTITGFENALAFVSGTSMASPHTAGAAALMRQLHPSWTVAEIKSALQMTATQGVILEDQVTLADSHGAGAGRTQVDRAARAGLVLDESYARYVAANPALGGNPASLNLASMEATNCSGGCSFVRTVRNTLPHKQKWRLQLEGLHGSVEPASMTLNPGQSRQILVTIEDTGLTPDGNYGFGAVMISARNASNSDPTLPDLRMPVAVRLPPPPPPTTPLSNGVPVAVSGAAGSQMFYSFVVPAGLPSLSVVLQGPNGDADLFVKWGEAPLGGAADCASTSSTSNETCNIVSPKAGTWYVRVDGFSAFTGATLTATW